MRREEDLYVETNYRILYEDNCFFAVEKPAPLPVHPVGRFKKRNLLSLLQNDFPSFGREIRIVNRLDSETSGIVIAAKSSEWAGKLGLIFENRKVLKEYRAVVIGGPPENFGVIDIPLGTRQRNLQHLRVADSLGEKAVTHYEVLERGNDFSLLKVTPVTGKTHQIRVHLSILGCPIAGDKIYIDPDIFENYVAHGWQEAMLEKVKSPRLLLHASSLEFLHPETGRFFKVHSALPECFSMQGLFAAYA